jgi:hypothetical protein
MHEGGPFFIAVAAVAIPHAAATALRCVVATAAGVLGAWLLLGWDCSRAGRHASSQAAADGA